MGMLSRALKREPTPEPLQVDGGILSAMQEIAELRGMDVNKLIEMQLRMYVNAFERCKIFGLDTIMPYGKYQNNRVEDIIRADPRYVNFLLSSPGSFQLDDECHALLEKLK